jgi:hypothetical protein
MPLRGFGMTIGTPDSRFREDDKFFYKEKRMMSRRSEALPEEAGSDPPGRMGQRKSL